MTKQNDAVFQAVCSVRYCDSFDDVVILTKEEKAFVITMVTNGIISGGVDFSAEAKAKYDTEAKIKGYVGGMVSNHLRKDKRLNGNVKYEAANPGSRAGQGDEQLKALKALRSTLTDASDLASIDEAITTRLAEVSVKKAAAAATINIDALPEEFRHLVK